MYNMYARYVTVLCRLMSCRVFFSLIQVNEAELADTPEEAETKKTEHAAKLKELQEIEGKFMEELDSLSFDRFFFLNLILYGISHSEKW